MIDPDRSPIIFLSFSFGRLLSSLKSKVREFTDFVSEHGLMEVFREFIRPKSMKEKLEIGKQKSREMESQKRNSTVVADKKHDIAI